MNWVAGDQEKCRQQRELRLAYYRRATPPAIWFEGAWDAAESGLGSALFELDRLAQEFEAQASVFEARQAKWWMRARDAQAELVRLREAIQEIANVNPTQPDDVVSQEIRIARAALNQSQDASAIVVWRPQEATECPE